jgi:hypothetical protein
MVHPVTVISYPNWTQALHYDEAINADPSKRVSKIFAATDEQTHTNTHTH